MAYRMTELTTTVRAGKRGDGALDIEVWTTPRGWLLDVECAEDMPEQISADWCIDVCLHGAGEVHRTAQPSALLFKRLAGEIAQG